MDKTSIYFVKFTHKFFILFDAVVNGIIVFIFGGVVLADIEKLQ